MGGNHRFSDLMVNREANQGGDADWVKVPPSLRRYSYWGGDAGTLAYTTHGITIGSTVAELQALGDLVTFHFNACGDSVDYAIADPGGTNGGQIWGYLDGTDWEAFIESSLVDPEATVRSFQAGAQSSC